MSDVQELSKIAAQLAAAAAKGDTESIAAPLKALNAATAKIGRAFCGSWLGYHSRVYYEAFQPTPPGTNFNQEWGLRGAGNWREFSAEEVKSAIYQLADNPDLGPVRATANAAALFFNKAKAEALSILEIEVLEASDPLLAGLKDELQKLEPLSSFNFAEIWSPKGPVMTRDTLVMGQGKQIPPHTKVRAEVAAIQQSFAICAGAADVCIRAASHLKRKSRRGKPVVEKTGTNVFIGHGHSATWRELQNFVQNHLGLQWDEFNRIPVAGRSNIDRLREMLDAAAFAFLVLTAEDETVDGEVQARMNVVHQAGLFQGHLGFEKAIVLLEDGCKAFSNIDGLVQIRFPKNQLSSKFEDIRRVLEREGLLAISGAA
jgi:predicted nucleotide-binding protein